MKKMIFSAAAFGLVAASGLALAPTNAEAIPAFARQTGAACLSCHFQEIPALASFGRSFKEDSFTDVGDQALVEDDNLSIPAVLNATMVVAMQVIHTSGGPAGTPSSTVYNIPVDTNFLVAGRIGAHTGAFVEFGGGSGDTIQAANNIQMMNSWNVGGFKVGFGFSDTSFGGDAVMNPSSVYGQHSGNLGGLGVDVGAINNSGFVNSTSEVGVWAGNDMGFAMFGLVAPGGKAGWTNAAGTATGATGSATQGTVNVGTQMGKLFRIAGTFDLGGFDTIVGGTIVRGKVGKGIAGGTAITAPNDMNMESIDAQMQGSVGNMTLGVYADWAHARGTANGNLYGAQDAGNAPAAGTGSTAGALGIGRVLGAGQSFDAYGIRASLSPVVGYNFGIGYGHRKTVTGPAAATSHSIFAIAASYQLYMNSVIALEYKSDNTSITGTAGNTVHTTTLDWHTYM